MSVLFIKTRGSHGRAVEQLFKFKSVFGLTEEIIENEEQRYVGILVYNALQLSWLVETRMIKQNQFFVNNL